MAKVITAKAAKELRDKSAKAEAKKLASQQKKHRGFTNHGQGVIPEQVWKNLPGKEKSSGPQ